MVWSVDLLPQVEALARTQKISLGEAARLMGVASAEKGDRLAITYDGETYTRTVSDVSEPDDEGAITLSFDQPL